MKVCGSRLTILWTISSTEYGQPGTINLYGPEYDQPVFVWEDDDTRVTNTGIFQGLKPYIKLEKSIVYE